MRRGCRPRGWHPRRRRHRRWRSRMRFVAAGVLAGAVLSMPKTMDAPLLRPCGAWRWSPRPDITKHITSANTQCEVSICQQRMITRRQRHEHTCTRLSDWAVRKADSITITQTTSRCVFVDVHMFRRSRSASDAIRNCRILRAAEARATAFSSRTSL